MPRVILAIVAGKVKQRLNQPFSFQMYQITKAELFDAQNSSGIVTKKKMAKDFQRFCVQETNCFSRIHESSILYKLLPREMCKCKFNSVRCLKKALCEKRDTSKSTHFAITLSVCRCGMLMRFPTCRTNIVSRLAKKGLSEGLHCRPPHVYFSFRSPFSFSIHSGNGCVVSLVCIAIASFISLVCKKQQRHFASLRT